MRGVLGLVPARGGSKGIPGKNVADVAGRPLLAYTAAAALRSTALDRVVLSTDDEEIARVGLEVGLEVPFLRPPALAADDTPMIDVVVHALDELGEDEIEAIVLLQPTSPLRSALDIGSAVALLRTSGAESVVSVTPVPHRFVPSSVLVAGPGGVVVPFAGGSGGSRRQDKEQLLARNGPAVLVVRPSAVRRGVLYGEPTVGYLMPPERSLDVDDEFDLTLARLLLLGRQEP